VELFTREHGRLTVVAKGARRSNSPFLGVIQQFMPLFVSWGGRSEMKTLYKAENVSGSVRLAGELIYTGFYLNELVMYLLHKHESHALLFDRYHQCLSELPDAKDNELVLRYFELDLLEQLGYGVSLDRDLRTGQQVNSEQFYSYDSETGITSLTGDEAGVLQVKGETLLALSQRNISTQEQRIEAKQLLRSILDQHLEGRPLNARKLFMKKKKFSLSQ
jgi:DNA repair protein RecO (recombination protein O)